MKDKVKQIHFVGIGGVGMAGIAEVCLNLGYIVSGSDLRHNATVGRLESLGALIQLGHEADHVKKSDVVVVSTAIPSDNPEVEWAKQARIPVIPRAEMLAELMRMRFGIAIAGTHGKTTTTSLTAAILTQGGLDPTFVIGGQLNQVGANARLGTSKYLVAEADESDASFLHLSPMISVVTNLEEDHMETYQGDYQNLENTFLEFIHGLPFYGLAIVCLDDKNVRNMLPKFTRKALTYGFDELADVRAINVQNHGLTMQFQVLVGRDQSFEIVLNIPGMHNVQNALAAIAIALELKVSVADIQKSLLEFGGVGRRFEVYAQRTIGDKVITLVDDYGHHPTELSATISTVQQSFKDKRLVLIFQPHRYSRTRDLFDDFVQALLEADIVILTEVFAAGEAVIPTFDSKALLQAMRLRGGHQGIFAENFEHLDEIVNEVLHDDDVVLVMGAGTIAQVASKWKERAGGEA